mgnify:FL=1
MTPTIIANAMCDDRVKSPLDPTDPLLGTSGIMSYKKSTNLSTTDTDTPENPLARELAMINIISLICPFGIGEPTQWREIV